MEDERPVVDGTRMSSRELRAEVRDEVRAQQDGRDEAVAAARVELLTSLDRLGGGLTELRSRATAKAVHVAKVAGGVAAVGAGVAGAVTFWWIRAGKRAAIS